MNSYKQLLGLLPDDPLLVVTVLTQHPDQSCTVAQPGGAAQRVRGAGYSVGQKVFLKAGVIEGAAPTLPIVTIEV